jgi:hypothetical protein
MFPRPLRVLLPLTLCLAAPVAAQGDRPITPADLDRHIQVLASDAYQGRAPGTEGETLTTRYIVDQLRRRGLEPAGENGGWFQAVPLVERTTRSHEARWTANGHALDFDHDDIALQGRGAEESVTDAPVIFAGHGARMPERGIDQIAGTDVHGAIVVILLEPPRVAGFPSLSDRVKAMADAGAAAVIALTGPELPWDYVERNYHVPATKLATQDVPPIIGAMPLAAAQRLIAAAGGDLERLLNDQPGSSFRAVTLPMRGSLQVSTTIHAYATNNVVGRIRGTGAGANGQNVLLMAHWDHFGLCRPPGAADRICNGAVDNASGVAEMIEIAGRIAARERPARDVIVLATTAEEKGLLGAAYFATHPIVPLRSIVAAINMDTVAIAPAGEPVAEIGRGYPPLDALIGRAIADAGRHADPDQDADAFAQRQDGWVLSQAGVPSVMIGGAYADIARLQRFLSGPYHSPDDEAGPGLELGGAAEDANLIVTIARRLADPSVYQLPANQDQGAAQ